MPRDFGALTMALVLGMVLTRVLLLKKRGIKSMHFGNLDKKDFLIPPFALFYFYTVFADAFGFPGAIGQQFFYSAIISWAGALFCLIGLSLLLWSLISFGRSFRVGIDIDQPDKLVTTGIFGVSRNPLYVAFLFVLAGQFLIVPAWFFAGYFCGAALLMHRQILREEDYLKKHYGEKYLEYCQQVRRYL
jgi:protein-S-isoprenylcysteine O-methyltransferase Ste14